MFTRLCIGLAVVAPVALAAQTTQKEEVRYSYVDSSYRYSTLREMLTKPDAVVKVEMLESRTKIDNSQADNPKPYTIWRAKVLEIYTTRDVNIAPAGELNIIDVGGVYERDGQTIRVINPNGVALRPKEQYILCLEEHKPEDAYSIAAFGPDGAFAVTKDNQVVPLGKSPAAQAFRLMSAGAFEEGLRSEVLKLKAP